jgi:hypothetical protein
MSRTLSSESKKYKWDAKKLSVMALMKQWAPLVAIILLAVILLLIRYLWR